MKKRLIAVWVILGLLFVSGRAPAFAEALKQETYREGIWEPSLKTDKFLSTGQETI